MKRFMSTLLRVAYFLTWPATSVILHNSNRVRVVLLHKDRVLLVKGGFGRQKWSLPGGGVHKGESYEAAAARELQEESSIALNKKDMKVLGYARLPRDKKWPVMNISFLGAQTPKLLTPTIIRPLEIIEVDWFPLKALPSNRSKTIDEGLKLLDTDVI